MAKKKIEITRPRKIAGISSVAMVIFLSAAFIIETRVTGAAVNYNLIWIVMAVALVLVFSVVRTSANPQKLAFNVPLILQLFYTALMIMSNWQTTHYLIICVALCAISCIYSNFSRTVLFIVVQNLGIILLVALGYPICGDNVPLLVILITWVICLFASIIMLVLTRSATVHLNRALEHQNSFRDLLDTTENFVAMINEHNEIVYSSKTLSKLGNVENPVLVQGRPIIDIFPGKSLKVYAGKMLKEKDNYAEDWEFNLLGQKRYFKAISHRLEGSGGTLISLYDMTHLAERDEIAAMKDSMQIGLFFMDKNYVIQDHYSRYLEEMLSDTKLYGKLFTDIISDSVTDSEMDAIKDYFKMVIERSYDQDMLDDINPLNELHYVHKGTGDRKVFQCAFSTVERDKGEVFLLVTVYDITLRIELQKRLAEEEAKRQEEMQSFFELVQVEPAVFHDYMSDMEHEFNSIDKTMKNEAMSAHEAVVKVYQSVHAMKSNAVILGLSIFGNKLHNLESKIKKMREIKGEIPFGEMLNLTMDIEKIANEKEGFKDIIEKLQTYSGGGASGGGGVVNNKEQNVKVLVDALAKATAKAAEDEEKLIKFIANDIDAEALEKGPKRDIKDILMQLIRNSAVHGIEMPEVRKSKGKNENGNIKLSIKLTDDKKHIHIKLSDDGNGIDYKKVSQKALSKGLIKKEDADNKDALMKALFAPGFSTAETEGVHAGRGIGLNLVRDRIKEINGSVKLKTEAGKGTVFLISIPAAK
jgi:two-component system chemotaxis sensor kinase CheA